MPGIAGSLLQMIEGAGTGATLDLDAIPRPDGTPLERWLLTFPSFGFLLAGDERRGRASSTNAASPARPAARSTPSRQLKLSDGANTAVAWDLNTTKLTGLTG